MPTASQFLGAVLFIGAGMIAQSALTVPVPAPKAAEHHSSEAANMRQALSLDEECRGGQHTPDDETCRLRDRVFADLEKRGWCWAYRDINIMPADFRWHRC